MSFGSDLPISSGRPPTSPSEVPTSINNKRADLTSTSPRIGASPRPPVGNPPHERAFPPYGRVYLLTESDGP